MDRNYRNNSIFTSDAKEYLLRISAPKPGEVERVKKQIFSQLEAKYPQFKHRSFWFVDNIRFARLVFVSSLIFVIGISSYFTLSSLLNENAAPKDVAVIPARTIAPNETVLVQNDDVSKTDDLESGVIEVEIGGENQVSSISKKSSGDTVVAVSSNEIQSFDSNDTQSAPPVQNSSEGGYSVRKEGSVSVASGLGNRAILEDIDNSIQIEYLVEIR